MNAIDQCQQFLRNCTQRSLQDQWFRCTDQSSVLMLDSPLPLNDRGHIAWSKGRSLLWIGQDLVIPESLNGYSLRGLSVKFALSWWAELAEIFVNGVLVQTGDLFDCSARVLLTDRVRGGELFQLRVRLESPGHDAGAIVSSRLEFEQFHSLNNLPEPSFFADELGVIGQYLAELMEDSSPSDRLQCYLQPLQEMAGQTGIIALRPSLDSTIARLRDQFSEQWGTWIKQRQIHLLGHAHLDLAWLWPLAETWEVAERTFRSVLTLQQDFPELIFAHSSPIIYQWLQTQRPDLFHHITQAMQQGRWEVMAGLWVEPDVILPSGESLVRQVLYGQRYVQQELQPFLGQGNRVAWLPDSFGFSGQLPQILKQGGIDWFITQKLTWNDTTTFPHSLFQWQGLDGTIVAALMSAPIGKGVAPVEMGTHAIAWEKATESLDFLWLVGVGDHGGGPSRDMLETARRWERSPCFPRLKFTRLHDYLHHLETTLDWHAVPTWNRDLYLELHRGCYTTHGDQKRYNRQLESLLYRAELWATLRTIVLEALGRGVIPVPVDELEQAWKLVLLNQFHDILPGSSIPAVFTQATADWETAQRITTEVLQRSLEDLATAIHCFPLPPSIGESAVPLIYFNSVPQPLHAPVRSAVIALDPVSQLGWPELTGVPQAWTDQGEPLPVERSPEGEILIFLNSIPGVGYRVIWVDPNGNPPMVTRESYQLEPKSYQLENEFLCVTIDPLTGQCQQIYSKTLQRSILKAAGNQLQTFHDRGQYWDAWNIDPNYEQHPHSTPVLKSCQWLESHALRQRVRVTYQFYESTIQQDYSLDYGCPWLTVKTIVDWQADQVLLKVAFPLDLDQDAAPRFTTEIACGTIERPIQSNDAAKLTPTETAQWEVPLHRWMDLSTHSHSDPLQDWGVSILNDGKYGADVKDLGDRFQLRLSLIRSPSWPDPHSDRGHHEMTYAIYPHAHAWEAAHTVYYAQWLNQPLDWISPGNPTIEPVNPLCPPQACLLDLGAESLGLLALKPTKNGYLLRCYETTGKPSQLALNGLITDLWEKAGDLLSNLLPTDGLENPDGTTIPPNSSAVIHVKPWQIKSWRLPKMSGVSK